VRAVRENIQPRTCCIDRVVARSIQQDRGWIFFRTARTVEVSKFFIIWHCTFVKNGKKGHARAKYKVRHIWKKNNCKTFSLGYDISYDNPETLAPLFTSDHNVIKWNSGWFITDKGNKVSKCETDHKPTVRPFWHCVFTTQILMKK
jgi:hypothetical protein